MHFTASIPAGEELCGDFGEKIARAFREMEAGRPPAYMVDPTESARFERDCKL
jgi:hypothetical protein